MQSIATVTNKNPFAITILTLILFLGILKIPLSTVLENFDLSSQQLDNITRLIKNLFIIILAIFAIKKLKLLELSGLSKYIKLQNMLDDLKGLSSKSGKMIVATIGTKGSIAFFENKSYYQKAIEISEVIDTTGCGDSFQAAFSIEWIHSKDIRKSLNAGAFAASKVLGFMGSVV